MRTTRRQLFCLTSSPLVLTVCWKQCRGSSGKITTETATEQDKCAVMNAGIIASSEAELQRWEMSARASHYRLRGFSMWPGVLIYFQVRNEEAVGEPFNSSCWKQELYRKHWGPRMFLPRDPTKWTDFDEFVGMTPFWKSYNYNQPERNQWIPIASSMGTQIRRSDGSNHNTE
jgi:hypothetical protein